MATYTKTITSNSYIWPKESQISLVCEGRITDQIVDDFGVNVKIREVSKTGFSSYGDASKSYIDTYSKAYMHQWRITDDEVKEGIYKNGQIMFVFKTGDKLKVKNENRIFYNSEWYKITMVEPQVMAGITYLLNALVDKIVT